VDETTI
jgi:hypothetical protein